jgi:hypothetical protein
MKTYLAGILVALAVFTAFNAFAGGDSVESGKVYVSDDGIEVAVVALKGAPKALVRVLNSGTELDGKARMHDVVDNGNRIEYRGKLHGGNFYTFHDHKNGKFSLYVPKRGEVRLKFSDEKTKALKPDSVLKDFQKQTKDGSLAALEKFDRKAHVAEAEKEIADEMAAAEKQCGAKIPVAVDWAAISDDAILKYSVAGFCSKPAGELKRLCESTEGKTWVNAKVKRVQCKLATSGANMMLDVGGDGTLKWSTSTEAYNQEEFARKQLLGAPAGEGEPPWGKGETLAQRLALEKTAVCTDGKTHYVVAAPDEKHSTQLYWGDGKSFVEVPPPGEYMSGDTFYDPRHVNAGANPNFRGYDMRVYSSVDANLEKQSCAVRCGERTVALKWVPAAQARPLLMAAKVGPTPQKWRPHVLFRDDKGVYYYVDRGFKPGEEKRFRLFKGPKGSLKEQKMTNVVADSEGEIFSTKNGSLKMIIDRKQATTWVQAGKATKLREVPVNENLPLVYNELGVYLGEKMGTPCDEL